MTVTLSKLPAISWLALFLLLAVPTIVQAIEFSELSLLSQATNTCDSISNNNDHWQPIQQGEIPQQAHFCLRSWVTIHEGELEGLSSIAISILGATRISWDGITIAENGKVGTDIQSEIPGQIDFSYPLPPELTKAGTHLLTIEVSNFYLKERLSSILYYLDVIEYTKVTHKPWLIALVMVGALLVITLLFLLLNIFYEWRPNYLWVSALSLSFALLLMAEKYRAIFGYSYDLHILRLHLVLLFTLLSCICLCGFYIFYYELKKPFLWLGAFTGLFVLTTTLETGYDGKSAATFFLAIILSLLINAIAIFQRKRNASPNFLLSMVVLLTFLYSPWDFLESRFAYTSFGIIAVMMATLFHEMKLNKENALTAVRLEAELLKRNLQPHFLMNSLMLVVEWIEKNPKSAVKFVMALADELRILVKFSGLKLVPLDDELFLCKKHIEIMTYRYKANYQLKIEGETGSISIPPAILHTQIENTFTHNKLATDAILKLKIAPYPDRVEIIYDSPAEENRRRSKREREATSQEGMGVGDRYIRSRLDELFPNLYHYSSIQKEDRWINTLVLYKVK